MNNSSSPRNPGQTIFPPWFAHSFAARALSGIYGSVLAIRNGLYDHLPALSRTAARPVISIGGIRMGGTGKTPVALMVAQYLLSKNRPGAFLSRGYLRPAGTGLQIVKPHEEPDWELIGDEPGLLHNRLPETWLGIYPKRFIAARELAKIIPRNACFILDDGFQHRSIGRNLDIVCLHEVPVGDRLVPAGNLREGASALARAHIVLLFGQPETAGAPGVENQCDELRRRFPHLKVFSVTQRAGSWVNAHTGQIAETVPLKNPLLVCGIARPERFIAMVGKAGITPCRSMVFSDHHKYITNDFNKTRELYSNGAITTEKDAIRLKKLKVVADSALWYLNIDLCFIDKNGKNEFESLIDKLFHNLH